MANEYVIRQGLVVSGSTTIKNNLTVAGLAGDSGEVVSVGSGGALQGSGYSINQSLNTTSTPAFAGITVNGDASITGNLDVQGNINAVNRTDLNITDLVISVAAGSTTAAQANGAGLYISGAAASVTWDNSNSRIAINKPLFVNGAVTATSFTGTVNTATSASYATYAATAGTATSATTATTAGSATSATTATSASYSTYAATAGTATSATTAASATSASYATYAASAGTATSATTSTSASYATNAGTATTAGTATSATNATSSSFATNSSTTDDSTVVRLSTTQTISGVKTLTGDLKLQQNSSQASIISKDDNTSVSTSIVSVQEIAVSGVDACFFDYVIKNSTTDLRAGTLMVVTNGSTAEYTEISTLDIGNTSGVTLSADVSGGNLRFRAVAASGTWTVRSLARTI